jgi:hypothetical protein
MARIFNAGAETGTVSGKTDFTGQKKSKVGGRKPLGDLSNSVKPFDLVDGKKTLNGPLKTVKPSVILNKSKNKNNSTLILNKEVVSGKEKNLEIDKGTGSKASKKSNTGSRKALADISNSASAKLQVPDIKNKNSLKTSSLTGKYLHPDAIAEERMFHDHEQCIKSQTKHLICIIFSRLLDCRMVISILTIFYSVCILVGLLCLLISI